MNKNNNPANIGLVRMSDVTPKAVEWLWRPYIPKNKITLIRGDGGTGKTSLCLTLAAIVSTGGELPCGEYFQPVEAGNALFVSAEDDLEDTIAPKLIAAGADMDRIFSYRESDTESLCFTSPLFEEMIKQSRPKLVFADPATSFFGKIDMNRANHIRPVMSHLRKLAERYNCAIILLEHLNKHGRGRGFHRGLGSIDITSAARSVLMVGSDPIDPAECAFCQIKSNLGVMGDVVGFTLGDNGVTWNPDTHLTVEMIEGRASKARDYDSNALDEAMDFLRDVLADGKRSSKDIIASAKQLGISEPTLRRAREALGVDVKEREGFGKDIVVYWKLP